MRALLKGPLFVFVLIALLLTAALRGFGSEQVGSLQLNDQTSYPLAVAIADLLPEGAMSEGTQGLTVPGIWSLLILCLAATALFSLSMMWSGNRIVSLVGASLFALHPMWGAYLRSPDAIQHALPVLLLLVSVFCQEWGWVRRSREQSIAVPATARLLATFGACAAGPLGLMAPIAQLTNDVIRHSEKRQGRLLGYLLTGAAFAVAAICWWSWGTDVVLTLERLPLVTSWPRTALIEAHDGPVGRTLGWGMVGLSCLAFAAAALAARRSPRWVLMAAGLAGSWLLGGSILEWIGAVPDDTPVLLPGLAPLALVVPILAWRVLIALVPEPGAAPAALHLAPPQPVPEFSPEQVQAIHAWSPAGVRDPFLSKGKSSPPGKWRSWERAHAPALSLGPGDTASVYEPLWRSIFLDHVAPHLHTGGAMLLIGAPPDVFLPWLQQCEQKLIHTHWDDASLRRALEHLPVGMSARAFLSTPGSLEALATSSVDFVVSTEESTFWTTQEVYLALDSIKRVLSPGGRALLAFANLMDPDSLPRLGAWAARSATERPQRIPSFHSPEGLRVLVEGSGLVLEAVHLAANSRDMLVSITQENPQWREMEETCS